MDNIFREYMKIWSLALNGTSYGITFTASCAPKRNEIEMIYLREGSRCHLFCL